MYKEIDLHEMNYTDALNFFIKNYNESIKNKDRREIMVIHGYGANRLSSYPVIAEKLRTYFSKNTDKLKYRLDMNPGVTYVTPIKKIEI